jgi:3-oxoacyl-[acyl-carrier-protein] synthase II
MPEQSRRVAVVGIGAITSLGHSANELWESLTTTVDMGPLRVSPFPTDQLVNPKELRRLDPFALFALAAADEAWRQSGLSVGLVDGGSIFATGMGGLQSLLRQYDVLKEKGPSRVSPFMVPMLMPNAGGAAVSMRFGLGGPCETITTACAAGTHAISYAARLVASGRCPVAVTGGSEAVMEEVALSGFANMTALSVSGQSRPFDAHRDGFVMGEGAGALVLEDWDRAVARGATILAEVVGSASTADAHHVTAPDPSGLGASRSMRMALHEAGLNASDIQHINAHGTSTPLNDLAESLAVREVFGTHRPLVSSNKGHLGHCLGAAGAVEAVVSVMSLLHQMVPATAGTSEVDVAIDLDVVTNSAQTSSLEHVMSNSFGFGGHNGTIIFRRAD